VALFFPALAFANDGYITIVNPIRISRYNADPIGSLKAQYQVISQLHLPATWLLTYGALNNQQLIAEVKKFSTDQEVGLFLEVTGDFVNKANVSYHQTGSWHFANAVLLSGYSQEERIKLLDTIFSKYKDIFGTYPKSVGSWWTDSFSLNYIHNKYGVVIDLGCSDQYGTDNYFLWGQYWSLPYYPSHKHVGMPAVTEPDKLGVVRILWAPRDPVRGYESSLYSTQDYFTVPGLDFGFFKKLIKL